MNYQVLARKFRPGVFEDVIGQEHITVTLKNAIISKRIAHAYIFSGPRGVGKTTTARLLAKALNCENGPTDSPCGICHDCKEIAEGISIQVLEVDGASNNGVDNIRNLTDTIKYNFLPDKYKVYIIDEVHMLSTSAFNALLKNLEEPPPKVVFIFATTEIHKVPETILSRCQQFIFHLIPHKIIIEKLKDILLKEKINAEEKVFSIISNASGGSMRDAETILEKIITFCGKNITEEQVLSSLGLVSKDLFYNLSYAIINENTSECFNIVSKIFNEGKNISKFVLDSIDFFRNVLFVHLEKNNINSIIIDDFEKEKVCEISYKFNEFQLIYIIEILTELAIVLKNTHTVFPRVLVEIAFIKLSHSKNILPIDQVIKKINLLEDRLKEAKFSDNYKSLENVLENNDISLEKVSKKWNDFINHLKLKNSILSTYLNDSKIENLKDNQISITFPESSVFHAKILHQPENQKILDKELKLFFNHNISALLIINEVKSPPVKLINDKASFNEETFSRIESTGNNFVGKVIDEFEGDIVDTN